jgi:hypothetical protein
MISCTAGPTQIQSNSLLAPHRTGMVWHASGSDLSRQGRKGQATCVHRLCCHVWLKIAGRQAAKLQSREAWPTRSLERGLTSRRARRGVCSSCSLGDILARCGQQQLAGTSMPSHISGSWQQLQNGRGEEQDWGWEAQHLNLFVASF